MTSTTVATILKRTADELEHLMCRYESLRLSVEDTDPVKAQLAQFLAGREAATMAALDRYQSRHEHHAALDVHVRLASGFPFSGEELHYPDNPSLDELIELAERTDELLGQLSERIQVYAVSGELVTALEALEELVSERRRHLSAALQELEDYAPSPPRAHD